MRSVHQPRRWFSTLLLLAACAAKPALAQTPNADEVQRGAYLARAADCVACHTMKGGKPFAGGLAIALPMGTLYSPNITPDRETGIGSWTDDDFVKAMQDGVAKGGKHLYPAFPYPSYALMKREDVLAIKAYLFSLPPVRSNIPAGKLSFPFDQRYAMIGWNLLFKPGAPLQDDTSKPPEWNRGRYLVEALGHCGDCHTPRGLFQQLDNSQKFAGTVQQGWRAYNITSDKESGLGNWDDAALESYLRTGFGPGHSSAGGPMGEVVENSLTHLTQPDIRAMVVYLRSIAPIRNAPAIQTTNAAATQPAGLSLGARVFAGECANCHGWDGSAVQTPQASLVGSRTLNDPDGTNLIQAVLQGVHYRAGDREVFMPPFARGRSSEELAAVLNFVSARFGNGALHLTAADVQGKLSPPPQTFRISPWIIWGAVAVGVIVLVLLIALVLRLMRGRRRYHPAE